LAVAVEMEAGLPKDKSKRNKQRTSGCVPRMRQRRLGSKKRTKPESVPVCVAALGCFCLPLGSTLKRA
jgi:hypothetical protein